MSVESELAGARTLIEQFQTASGLCVPAEELGGDPGGVEPRHLERYVHELLEDVRQERRVFDWWVVKAPWLVVPGKIFPVELHFFDELHAEQWVEIVCGDIRAAIREAMEIVP